jgi:FkbM family methyltransferase
LNGRRALVATVPYGDGGRLLVRSDHYVGWHILFYGSYRPESLEAMSKSLKVGDVAVDVGASIGDTAIALATIVGRSGRVIAYEPHPGEYQRLQENVRMNNFTNVEAVNAAVGAAGGTCSIQVAEGSNQSNSFVSGLNARGECTIEVPIVALDEHLPETRVHLIKIDSQGSDLAVLRGGERLLTQCRPAVILNSIDEQHYRRSGTSLREVRDYLHSQGYDEWRWLRRESRERGAALVGSTRTAP